jgi:NAD(P)-dependent dehydrogenase (short-subunit alcohol dehydrogenase family)
MMNNKVWLITGAARGMGMDITKAALDAGHKVVATGRNTEAVATALRKSDNLLIVKPDVTKQGDADYAVKAAVEKFGRIDVYFNVPASSSSIITTSVRMPDPISTTW